MTHGSKKYLLLLVTIIFMGRASNTLPIENKHVMTKLTPSRFSVVIGDSVTVFLSVTYPDSFLSSEPYVSEPPLSYDVNVAWKRKQIPKPGYVTDTYGLLAYVLKTDSLYVGPFRIDFTADTRPFTVLSDSVMLKVAGVVTNPDAPPRPDRQPYPLSRNKWLFLVIILILLLISRIIFYVIYRSKSETGYTSNTSIDEISEFERIRAMRLVEKNEILELYTRVSVALRGFIHRNMHPGALYMTTGELLDRLAAGFHPKIVSKGITEVLNESDMVKFAKYNPPEYLTKTLIDRTLSVVNHILKSIEEEELRQREETNIKPIGTNLKNP